MFNDGQVKHLRTHAFKNSTSDTKHTIRKPDTWSLHNICTVVFIPFIQAAHINVVIWCLYMAQHITCYTDLRGCEMIKNLADGVPLFTVSKLKWVYVWGYRKVAVGCYGIHVVAGLDHSGIEVGTFGHIILICMCSRWMSRCIHGSIAGGIKDGTFGHISLKCAYSRWTSRCNHGRRMGFRYAWWRRRSFWTWVTDIEWQLTWI